MRVGSARAAAKSPSWPEAADRAEARAPRATNAVIQFPRGGHRLELTRLAPSGRSIVIGLVLLLAAAAAYAVGRETSAFAVTEIAVEGPPAHVAGQVTGALAGTRGDSLLALDLRRRCRRSSSASRRSRPRASTARFRTRCG